MKNEYISISEFAAAAGVSQQSVYKRLRNKDDAIQPFFKKIGGKKYISKYAIDVIYREEEPHETTQEEQTEEPQEEPKEEKTNDNILLEILQQQLETLRNELEVKNKQIENLNDRLAEANNLINQQQQLHLLDTQRMAALEAAAEEETKEEEIKQEEEPKKRGFLGLFKKKK